MKFLLKLNGISALFGLLFFIALELMVNVYRISRLTGWELGTVNQVVFGINIVLLIIFSILILLIVRKWMETRKSTYWSVILWLPYSILYVYIFASLFPIVSPGETPNPGFGFVIFGMLFLYPFYIAVINLFGLSVLDGDSS